MEDGINRREFLGGSAYCAGAIALGAETGCEATDKTVSRKVRIAVMGVNDRGRQLTSLLTRFPQAEIAYICDPDEAVVGAAVGIVTASGRPAPQVATDFRRALDDPKVDALVCAAPDHWHALATILACQAGKDVYVEKPASLYLNEGRLMVEAARKHNRIVQVGTQRRSGADFQSAVEIVQSGNLGKVGMARAWANKVRPSIGREIVRQPPSKLDFDLWCGPAANKGYKSNLVHYNWHWRWDYGTGECGNLGVHSMDVARWALRVEYPRVVCCGGGGYGFNDDKETPDTQFATFDFDDVMIQWEHRMWSHRGVEDNKPWGVAFYGTEGTLFAFSSGWKMYRKEKLVDSHAGDDCQTAHMANFLDCVITRQLPNADIEIGHRSAALAHLANLAWRTRSTIQFDAKTETIVDNEAASQLAVATYRPGFELP